MTIYTISSGVISSGIVLNSNDIEYVLSGGVTSDTMVNSGGSEIVYGTANSSTVNGGGSMTVSSGGIVNNTTLNDGEQFVNSSGTANSTTVNGNARTTINYGGIANNTVVNLGGGVFVESGGVANKSTLLGFELVLSGGVTSGTTVNHFGTEVVQGGTAIDAILYNADEYVSGNGSVGSNTTVYSGGRAVAVSGGVINNTTVFSGGLEVVSTGGVGNNATINSGSIETVSITGISNNTTINSGGFEIVYGTANSSTVNGGGSMTVFSGGIVKNTTLNDGEQFVNSNSGLSPSDFTIRTTALVPSSPSGPTITQENTAGYVDTGIITLTGIAQAGNIVQAYDDTTAIGASTLADATGAYSITLATALIDGQHDLDVTSTNVAGLSSAASAITKVIVDTIAPTLTVTESISGLTSKTSDVISGRVTDTNGITGVEVYDGGNDLGAAIIAGTNWTYTATGLLDGIHTFAAIATDNAGNSTASISAGSAVISYGQAVALQVAQAVAAQVAADQATAAAAKIASDQALADANIKAAVAAMDAAVQAAQTLAAQGASDQATAAALAATDQAAAAKAAADLITAAKAAADQTVAAQLAAVQAAYDQTTAKITSMVGDGNTAVSTLAGNTKVTLNGYSNTVTGTTGDKTVTGGNGNTTVLLGNGTEQIDLGGYNNVIAIGTGTGSVIQAGIGNDTVSVASGSASVQAGGWGDSFTFGDGAFSVGGMHGNAAITLTHGFLATDNLDLLGTAGDTFTDIDGTLTITDVNHAVYATINATATGQDLQATPDGHGGMTVTLATHPSLTGTASVSQPTTLTETQSVANLQIGNGLMAQATLKTLVTFNGADGASPTGLIEDAAGNFFGATSGGGDFGKGTVFELASGTQALTTLANFSGAGIFAGAGLTIDSVGDLYGTTNGRGSFQDFLSYPSTVFELVAGSHAITTLASLEGGFPSQLAVDSHGNVYGVETSSAPGAHMAGTNDEVFEVVAGSDSATLVTGMFEPTNTPPAGLVADPAGNHYGSTVSFGPANYSIGTSGSLFEIAAGTNVVTSLWTFDGLADGAYPSVLVEDRVGNLYGATSSGGINGYGTIFEITAATHSFVTLASFSAVTDQVAGGLLVDAVGDIFGTTPSGGLNAKGSVFELAVGSHAVVTIASFDSTNTGTITGSLTADSVGNLYGTTTLGSANGYGTVFEVSNSGFIAYVPQNVALVRTPTATNSNAESVVSIPTLAAPTITQKNAAGYVATDIITLTGTAEAGSTVQAYDGITAIGTPTLADVTGAYSITLTTALIDGPHSLDVTATSAANAASAASATTTVIVDTLAPTLTVTESITGLTNQTSDVISGTVYDLNGVKAVEVYDDTTDLGTATVTGNTWTYTAAGLLDGIHTFAAIATDKAGNPTASISAGGAVIGYGQAAAIQAAADAAAQLAAVQAAYDQAMAAAQAAANQAAAAQAAADVASMVGDGNTAVSTLAGTTKVTLNGYANTVTGTTGDKTVTGGDGHTTVLLGNGTEQIDLGGYNNVIAIGTGTGSVIQAGIGNDTVSVASGSASVQAGGWGDSFTFGDGAFSVGGMQGNAAITLTHGFSAVDSLDMLGTAGDTFTDVNGTLTITDANHAVYATIDAIAAGQDLHATPDGHGGMMVTLATHPSLTSTASVSQPTTLTETQGNANLQIGNGDRTVVLTGWNNVVAGGTGTHVVSGAQGDSAVTLLGDNTVTMGGYNNFVVLGTGTNTVQAGDGDETVTLAGGADVVHLAGWNNLVIGGLGSTQVDGGSGNIYQVAGIGTVGGFTVTDFGTGNNDVLDLSKVLGAWDHTASGLASLVQVTASGNDTAVSVFGGGSFHQVALLQGANAASLADLQSHNALKLG